jgi:hypothetical protein
VLGNITGVGRNTLSFLDSVLSKPQTIKVDILSSEDAVLASATTVVTPAAPTLAVYENHPLYGFMFHRETSGTHELRGREVTFSAFPFFFSALNRADSALNFQWLTNVGEAETSHSVTYRTPEDAEGTSSVEVRVSNDNMIRQSATKNFLVQFGEQTE